VTTFLKPGEAVRGKTSDSIFLTESDKIATLYGNILSFQNLLVCCMLMPCPLLASSPKEMLPNYLVIDLHDYYAKSTSEKLSKVP